MGFFSFTLAPGYMVYLGTGKKLTINPKMTIFLKTIYAKIGVSMTI